MLVVDDDEGVRAVMATALEDDGWDVETAENGRLALDALQARAPQAIILDLRMPVMDGLTFANRYREFPEPRAPLILISATVDEAAVRATGAVTGLRKPIDLTVLLKTVRRHATATAVPRRSDMMGAGTTRGRSLPILNRLVGSGDGVLTRQRKVQALACHSAKRRRTHSEHERDHSAPGARTGILDRVLRCRCAARYGRHRADEESHHSRRGCSGQPEKE